MLFGSFGSFEDVLRRGAGRPGRWVYWAAVEGEQLPPSYLAAASEPGSYRYLRSKPTLAPRPLRPSAHEGTIPQGAASEGLASAKPFFSVRLRVTGLLGGPRKLSG